MSEPTCALKTSLGPGPQPWKAKGYEDTWYEVHQIGTYRNVWSKKVPGYVPRYLDTSVLLNRVRTSATRPDIPRYLGT